MKMKILKIVFLVSCMSFIFNGGVKDASRAVLAEDRVKCLYYDEAAFFKSVNVPPKPHDSVKEISGAIVPHHLLADDLISSLFKLLSREEVDMVFIIGPNHARSGSKKIATGSWTWDTPFGGLECDRQAVEETARATGAEENLELLQKEHSVAALVPYVKYYLPGARLVPVILHGDYGAENAAKLGKTIAATASAKKKVVITSVDFSHYLNLNTAEEMDKITLSAIKERDIEVIGQMGNDNIDSPLCVITLLSFIEEMGKKELTVTGHGNSADYTGNTQETTSYYTMLFY